MKLFHRRNEFVTVRDGHQTTDEEKAERGFTDLGERHPALAAPSVPLPSTPPPPLDDDASLMTRAAVRVVPRRGAHFRSDRKLHVPAGCATR